MTKYCIGRIYDRLPHCQPLNSLHKMVLILGCNGNVALDSREPLGTGEAVDECDRAKSNQIGQKGWLLRRNDNSGAVMPLETNSLKERFVQRFRAWYVEHILAKSIYERDFKICYRSLPYVPRLTRSFCRYRPTAGTVEVQA